MSEGALSSKMKKYMEKRGAYIETIWGSGFQSAGIPDLIGCYRGRFIGVEVKLDYNHASPIQLAKIELIIKAGGNAIVAYSLDEVERMFDQIDKEMEKTT